MKQPLVVGCLFSLFCQSFLFASDPQYVAAAARHSQPSFEREQPAHDLEESFDDEELMEQDHYIVIGDVESFADMQIAESTTKASPSESVHQIKSSSILDFRVQIGGNYTWASIRPHGHTSFEGNLGGAQGLFEYKPIDSFYGAVKLAWREGRTTGSAGSRSLVYVDTQERLGYTLGLWNDDLLLTGFSGFGYKYLGQELRPKHGSSVTFNYNEIYIPVGGIADYVVNSWFAIGAGFTWMPQIYPTVKIVPLKGARWIITDQLANFYVEMPFTFTLTADKRFSIVVNPFYEYWQDGHSTAKTSDGTRLGLPGNTYNFGGVDVNFMYSF